VDSWLPLYERRLPRDWDTVSDAELDALFPNWRKVTGELVVDLCADEITDSLLISAATDEKWT
jgi:hypothetical protein